MSADYCHELVRQGDKDRYLSTLLAPDAKRPQLLALYAFNIEIARIRETVSEAALGEIRLRWWADAIEAAYAGERQGHPVIEALAPVITEAGLPKQALLNMIEARQFDLYDDPMPSLGQLEGYLGETSAMLIQLAAMILDKERARSLGDISGLAGVALGITGLMRSLPLQRKRGQCYVPTDLLAKHGLTPAHLLSGREPEAIGKVLADLRAHAAKRLEEARALSGVLTPQVFPAYLPASLTGLYLSRLAGLGTGALTEIAEIAQWRRQWTLYRKARSQTL
ncbi:phytoene/squalene synthase family protein [Aestuariivirga sp. YIM B02566]|uniref:Phytoene/squalene synthase family protein n=1 Tax=Taklimakanibacter albus TaxID=2800327 RepID=A0ACC5R2J2_9HYPH|nr:phytoene/squalene synthase family protein [Aestuariivirga sp. YIM B02566]MBK1866691.1 phytoene/squalene synthase family protein [Aestuariivirga sp. YIM B02566]